MAAADYQVGPEHLTLCRLRAQIAGLELRELNALEREFLFLLDFRLAVRRDEYDAYAAVFPAMRIPTAINANAAAVPYASAAATCEHMRDVAALVRIAGPLCACGGGCDGGCIRYGCCKARVEAGLARLSFAAGSIPRAR